MSSKYMRLADALRSEIFARSGESRGRLPTEMELSRQYQVSRQTVRQALSVLLEEGLIEKRQGSGTYIAGTAAARAAAAKSIAILTPFVNDSASPSILRDIQSVFSAEGYHSQVFSTENQFCTERAVLQNLLERPVCAVLAAGTRTAFPNPNLDLYRRLSDRGVSVTFWQSVSPNLEEFPCVCPDDETGGYMLAQHLIREGHTRIAGIFRSDDRSGHRRQLGCVRALCDHGLSFDDRHFFWYDISQRDTPSEPLNLRLLLPFIRAQLPECSAVVCQNDEVAYFLIRELQRLNIRVPGQISVVGFDNSYFSERSPVKITALFHRGTSPWVCAAQSLLRIIERKTFSPVPLSWTLLKKDSDTRVSY